MGYTACEMRYNICAKRSLYPTPFVARRGDDVSALGNSRGGARLTSQGADKMTRQRHNESPPEKKCDTEQWVA